MKLDHASGIAVAFLGLSVMAVAWGLPFTDGATTLGPGMFPFALGLLLLLLGVALFWSASLAATPAQTVRTVFGWRELRRPALAIGILAVSVALFDVAGFAVSILVLMIGYLRAFGSYSWMRIVTIAVATTAASYALFGLALKVPISLLPSF